MSLLSRTHIWFLISGIAVTLSVFSLFLFPLNMGIDFTGGTQMEIAFSQKPLPSTEEISHIIDETFEAPKGQKIVATADKSAYIIRLQKLTDTEVMQFGDALNEQKWNADIRRVSTIGPSVGKVFQKRAFWAIGLAVSAIILYVAFAFRQVPKGLSSWRFGITAIIALAHDVLIVIGLFSFLNIEVDTLFITALLATIGFSVNDTIVIFDRVRENIKGKSLKNFAESTERALWQSMRRSLNTSLSTLIVIGSLLFYFVGFPTLFSFFLALTVGIVVGTYSSLFLAAPLLVVWHQKKK